MKRYLILPFVLLTLLFTACGSGETENPPTTEPDTETITTNSIPEDPKEVETESEVMVDQNIFGFYVGDFNADDWDDSQNYTRFNKINISIDRMDAGKVYGHSVVAGNDRPFEGPYTLENGKYQVEAAEPGDDKYDGVFTFTINPAEEELVGTWESNDKKLAVTRRKYVLEKTTWAYDPNLNLPEIGWMELYDIHGGLRSDEYPEEEYLTDDVTKFNASTTLLKKEDVENMYKGDLEVIRNSIYARHGYSFKNRRMRFVFDRYVDWYVPTNTDIRNQLTDIETQNIDLLKRYEAHAENYYDYFGR